MKTSIATVCLSGGLREKLEAIAAAGFRGVEIFESDLLSYNGTPADVAREMSDLGLRAITFQPFRDFEGMPDSQRQRTFDRAERKFDLMQEIEFDLLMVCSNVSPEWLGGIDRAAADFRQLGELGCETRLARRVRSARLGTPYQRLSRRVGSGPARGPFCYRSRARHLPHLCTQDGLKPLHAIPGDRIFLVQLADAPWLEMDILSWSRHFRCFPGQGDMPLVEFMEAMLVTEYDGEFSLEIFNDQFRAGSPRAVAVDGQRSLIYLMDQLRGKNGTGSLGIPAMPPRSKCLGVEFIEFAVDDRSGDELAQFLFGLGFQKAAQHKSKAVTRWTQGSVNLVINKEKEGFAHSHYITHGPSVAAIGLKVESAEATLDRAEKLCDTPFRQKVGPGELEIPAVRGVRRQFGLFPRSDEQTRQGLGRRVRADQRGGEERQRRANGRRSHFAIDALRRHAVMAVVLHVTSGRQKTPQVDVMDPGGIVRSQVVEAADGTLRFALNASQSQRTQSSRFLSEYFGSGVQHIAFATNDIVATVARLQANGVALLSIPEDYYDDLEARVGMPADRLKTLKANNILYDKDGDGEYLQIYTQSFKDLFFLEIVERRGYKGFGAVNASIRLNAQSRLARGVAESRI